MGCNPYEDGTLRPLFDIHTHTIASGHAYSTLKENIDAARAMGMKVLGTSEHAVMTEGTAPLIYFQNFKVIPKEVDGLRLLNGIEANIYDGDGSIDVSPKIMDRLDYIIASMHVPCYSNLGEAGNTRAILGVIKNPKVKIIGHPDDMRFPVSYDEIAAAAAEHHTALELNNGSLNPLSVRKGARENIYKMLDACRKYKTMVIMNTDSHICYEVAHFEDSMEVLKSVNFPPEQILNFDLGRLNYVLNHGEM